LTTKQFQRKVIWAGAVAALFLWIFFSIPRQTGKKVSRLSGVILAPPPGFYIVSLGNPDQEPALKQIAETLKTIIGQNSGKKKLGLQFNHSGGESFFLVDFSNAFIRKTAANTSGTVVQTTWKGSVNKRIDWCIKNGNFTPPTLSGPEIRNLYH